jgi:aspartate carbamoyltransferase regulatory subunit
MIKILKYGEVTNDEIFARSVPEVDVAGIVSDIIATVRARGDAALLDYCEKFDRVKLDALEVSVAIIMNVVSGKMGKKDIIKVDADIPLDFQVVGYVDPGATVNVIRDGRVVKKRTVELPDRLTDVIRCYNPRCITTTEQELKHVFCLRDDGYRCMYCETKAE